MSLFNRVVISILVLFISNITCVFIVEAGHEVHTLAQTKFVKASDAENKLLTRISMEIMPDQLIKLCDLFVTSFPNSINKKEVSAHYEKAKLVLVALASSSITVDLVNEMRRDAVFAEDITKAMLGDNQAAFSVAYKFAPSTVSDRLSKIPKYAVYSRNSSYSNDSKVLSHAEYFNERYEQWMKYSMNLGNGDAAWLLYEWYNENNQIMEATSARTKAEQLGYKPPVELCKDRKSGC